MAVQAARRREIGILSTRRAKKQRRTMVSVTGYFLLILSNGASFKKPLKCLYDRAKNLKAMEMENNGIGM
jgi:hypothetical protein